MQEGQVSVDGEPRPLPDPFLVVATQNPIEYEGTYPLPEAQLDRFLMKSTSAIPTRPSERTMLRLARRGVRSLSLDEVAAGSRAPTTCARRAPLVDATTVSDEVADYLVDVVRADARAAERRARREPARRGAPARRPQGGGAPGRPRVRDARRRRGPRRPVLAHRLVLRPEAELERVTPARRSPRRWRRCRCRDDADAARRRALLGSSACCALILPAGGSRSCWRSSVAGGDRRADALRGPRRRRASSASVPAGAVPRRAARGLRGQGARRWRGDGAPGGCRPD